MFTNFQDVHSDGHAKNHLSPDSWKMNEKRVCPNSGNKCRRCENCIKRKIVKKKKFVIFPSKLRNISIISNSKRVRNSKLEFINCMYFALICNGYLNTEHRQQKSYYFQPKPMPTMHLSKPFGCSSIISSDCLHM